MPKCDFNKVVLHGRSSVNLLNIFRRPFPMNTSGRLLLDKEDSSIGIVEFVNLQ